MACSCPFVCDATTNYKCKVIQWEGQRPRALRNAHPKQGLS